MMTISQLTILLLRDTTHQLPELLLTTHLLPEPLLTIHQPLELLLTTHPPLGPQLISLLLDRLTPLPPGRLPTTLPLLLVMSIPYLKTH